MTIARLVGGPLDGHTVDVTTWAPEGIGTGVLHVVEGRGDRADDEPEPGGDPLCWIYRGPVVA
jgi:hypothetical protein